MDQPDVKSIDSVQFSILSPKEIVNRSVVEVTKQDTYDKEEPVIKGLFDPRMGVTDMGKVCKTCGQKNIDCPGHFGHINLARPILNFHFIEYIMKVLKCVCFRCSKMLIDKKNIHIGTSSKKNPKNKFTDIYVESQKINRCGQFTEDGCNCKQPDKYKFNGLDGIKAHFKELEDSNSNKIEEVPLSVEYIKSLFERISDEDCRYLGLNPLHCRPEWLICSIFPVPPPATRPSVKKDNSQRMDDDLTHKLVDIIKANKALKDKIESNARTEIIEDLTKVLQYHCAILVDNDIPGLPPSIHRSGRSLKSIRQRLKGKEGRIRNNLMGKRVDFSARSVITPDPNIELDELGVPIKIAMNLTFPEKVNIITKTKLEKLVKNGPLIHPGVKSIIKKEGIKISINNINKDDIEIENGDIINRHLMDGDWVLFNRQPSLHRMSMMGHRVRVMSGNTFRLNVSVTPPYNADFDGDEMNLHAPQSYSTRLELSELMCVKNQIISPGSNKPIITVVQDTLLGLYKLTNSYKFKYSNPNTDSLLYLKNTNCINVNHLEETNMDNNVNEIINETSYFTKKQMMNLLIDLTTFDGTFPKADYIYKVKEEEVHLWTGKQILSYALPKYLNLKMQNGKSEGDDDIINFVDIVDGIIKSGTFDKNLFSKTSKGIIHTIYNDNKEDGPSMVKNLIDDLQKITTYFILNEGFSIGISDMIVNDNTMDNINNIITDKKNDVIKIMEDIHFNIFENYTGESNKEYFEKKVNGVLNESINETGKLVLNSLDHTNRASAMINSGSKGKLTNISQIVACLGQQNVDGKRIPYGFEDRTLPHYKKFDDSAEARGFVSNSFITGQTPQEFFFHAMGGREGLIDTAVKTAATGYVQRKLVKSMEDLKVEHDYSVRTSSGIIVQFKYGDDGFDGMKIESQSIPIINMKTEQIIKEYSFTEVDDITKIYEKEMVAKYKSQYTEDQNKKIALTLIDHRDYLIKTIFNYKSKHMLWFPVHLGRIISNTLTNRGKKSDMLPSEIIELVNKLKETLYIDKNNKKNPILTILLDIYLNPKILIKKHKIQKQDFLKILDMIIDTYNIAIVNPGEMVGTLAAQSIGEPATQMTLNTFHFAGVSSKSNVTRGIPRLQELLSTSVNIASPSVKIYISDSYKQNKNKCNFVKNKLEYTILNDIVTESNIIYDPKNSEYESIIDQDNEFLKIYKDFYDSEQLDGTPP